MMTVGRRMERRPSIAVARRGVRGASDVPAAMPRAWGITLTAEVSAEAAAIVRVRVPSPLRSYTGRVDVDVAVPVLAPELPPTIGGVLAALDVAYPGVRFRMIDEQGNVRPHIRLFVGNLATRDLAAPVGAVEVLMIVAALSGG